MKRDLQGLLTPSTGLSAEPSLIERCSGVLKNG
jgi:hypothetical protein